MPASETVQGEGAAARVLDRELRIRVYRDGRMTAMIFIPYFKGQRCISSHVFNRGEDHGWKYVIMLIQRVQKEWMGLRFAVRIRYQGVNVWD